MKYSKIKSEISKRSKSGILADNVRQHLPGQSAAPSRDLTCSTDFEKHPKTFLIRREFGTLRIVSAKINDFECNNR